MIEDRFPLLSLDQLDPETRPLADEMIEGSSAGLAGPYNVMLRSPAMARGLFELMKYFRSGCALPKRYLEFAILIQARLWTSNVEWYSHYPRALEAGLPKFVADDLKANLRPRNMAPDETIVYEVCMEMSVNKQVSEELFNAAKKLLGEGQLVDLIAVCAIYQTVAMMLSLNRGGWPVDKLDLAPFREH